jgi:hypothetical protein
VLRRCLHGVHRQVHIELGEPTKARRFPEQVLDVRARRPGQRLDRDDGTGLDVDQWLEREAHFVHQREHGVDIAPAHASPATVFTICSPTSQLLLVGGAPPFPPTNLACLSST